MKRGVASCARNRTKAVAPVGVLERSVPRERVALASRVPHPIAIIEREDGAPGWLSGLLRERDGAEETVGIVTRTGGKEELIGRSVGSSTLPELNGPYVVYLDGLASGISKRPPGIPR